MSRLWIVFAMFLLHFSVKAEAPLLPNCASSCISSLLPSSGCSFSDTTCVCSNQHLMHAIEECVVMNCTIVDSLSTKNATATMCGATIRTKPDVITYLPLTVAAFVSVLLRLFSRHRLIGAGGFGTDDATIIVAALLLIPFTVFCNLSRYHGLGRDIWTIPPAKITKLLQDFYRAEIVYTQLTAFTKASFLFFCKRIFPFDPFRRYLNIIIIASFAYGITFSLTYAFQCVPISYSWTRWDHDHSGKCINTRAMAWAQSIVNTILDLVVIIAPLPQLFTLHLSWKKKTYVILMFSVGFFITIVSCIRLAQIALFGGTTNPSWDWYGLGIWSIIEIDVSIICVCMPSLLVILRRMLPKIFGSNASSSITSTVVRYNGRLEQVPEIEQGGIARLPSTAHSDTVALVDWGAQRVTV